MLEYYLPGLDASTLSESKFITKVAYLLRIREMEKAEQINKVMSNIFGN